MLRDYPGAVADFDKAIDLVPGYKNAIDNPRPRGKRPD